MAIAILIASSDTVQITGVFTQWGITRRLLRWRMASNIVLGRDAAGVDWRSDGIEGLKLGEVVAIGILRDWRATYHEAFQGFPLTTLHGITLTI